VNDETVDAGRGFLRTEKFVGVDAVGVERSVVKDGGRFAGLGIVGGGVGDE